MGNAHIILKYLLPFAACTGFSTEGKAGNDNYSLGARSSGLAGTSVVITDIWSSANNQAGLGYLDQPAVAVYYENRMNVKELSLQAGAFAMPVGSTVIGVNYRYFGYSKYNESKFGLAVAKKLWEKFSLGIQVDYFHTHFAADYGNFGNLCAEIGLLCEPVDNLTIGTHVFNISQSKQKANPDEKIPTVIRFGIGYSIKDKALISVETEKDTRMKAVFKCGVEFVPLKNLFLRCGLSTGVIDRYAFGIGYAWKLLQMDIAFNHHKVLGYSPHISINAKF